MLEKKHERLAKLLKDTDAYLDRIGAMLKLQKGRDEIEEMKEAKERQKQKREKSKKHKEGAEEEKEEEKGEDKEEAKDKEEGEEKETTAGEETKPEGTQCTSWIASHRIAQNLSLRRTEDITRWHTP